MVLQVRLALVPLPAGHASKVSRVLFLQMFHERLWCRRDSLQIGTRSYDALVMLAIPLGHRTTKRQGFGAFALLWGRSFVFHQGNPGLLGYPATVNPAVLLV